jgi:hypothetical protein
VLSNEHARSLHVAVKVATTRNSQPEQRRTPTPRLCHHRNNSFVLLAVRRQKQRRPFSHVQDDDLRRPEQEFHK